ncbi:hypothetical protein SAMD00019534_060160 [Acytostelium subglobosum LB1]|uniref:hypothetical protein n=1 Tax=Acytostelium subglobosum LB1 TaxID=1410327 RepID=UPI0006448E41|nr:hypothetical protein SAMD00019534_060160 [Acytostelium subglobosum LB1]GAM22841.1 hypothetical protein SAMD00019534_060160 [Acytostelium subglobosum LB1]|eukprot:XP_012754068.1 hypothetical protein SAMD00019534_060160 [Acytostelium subglobosum LB1]
MTSTINTKAVLLNEFGGPDKLFVKEIPAQVPKAGEVRVRVHAVGLNRAEVLFRQGMYFDLPSKFPASLGYEGAGVVESVGAGVTKFKVGDRVAANITNLQSANPTNLELAVFPETALVHLIDGQSFAEGASIWMAYLTGYFAMADAHKLGPGQVVVVTAASSSTGLAAIQLAHAMGATVIATSRTSAKKQQLLDFGADHFIATNEEDVGKRINEITKNAGANLIYDPVGGPLASKLISALAFRGTYLIYGILSPEPTPFPTMELMTKFGNMKAYVVLDYANDRDKLAIATDFINKNIPKFKSIVGKVFKGIESTPAAHTYLDSADLFGKVVVEFQ